MRYFLDCYSVESFISIGGAMKQFGNVLLVPAYAVGDPRHAQNIGRLDCFVPSHGIFIVFDLIVRPEISWPGDQKMVDYAGKQINKLKNSGILNDEAIVQLTPELWDSTFVDCRVQFESLELAKSAFEIATNRPDTFVDIYLYQNGRVVMKYD